MTPRLAAAFVLVLAWFGHGQAQTNPAPAPTFSVQDLGTAGGLSSAAMAINGDGVVVGYVINSDRSSRAVRARNGLPFEVLPGLENIDSQAQSVNASGDIAGYMSVMTASYLTPHAMRYTGDGVATDLGSLSDWASYGFAINATGSVAGWGLTYDGLSQAFYGAPGLSVQPIDTFGVPYGMSFAAGINDAGQIAGHAHTASGHYHAFRYTLGAGVVDLDGRETGDSWAEEINNGGQVVGRFYTTRGHRAFRYTDGLGMQDIDTLGGVSSSAFSINSHGHVVGTAVLATDDSRAFFFSDETGMIDLNASIDPASGWVLLAAYGINDAGEIVGQGRLWADPNPRAFKLVPRIGDSTPPVIQSMSATPPDLWPPDGRMVPVSIAVNVTDDADPAPACRVASVTSSEAAQEGADDEDDDGADDDGEDDDGGEVDIVIAGALDVQLRAKRLGGNEGRTYTLLVSCSDTSGNETSGTIVVLVPHSR